MGLAYHVGAVLAVSRAKLRLHRNLNVSGGFFSGLTRRETPDKPVPDFGCLAFVGGFFQMPEERVRWNALLVT